MANREDWGRTPPAYGYAPQPKRTINAENITLPMLMVVSVLITTGIGAWWAGAQFTEVKNTMERLADKMSVLAVPINERISRIEADLTSRTQSRWTKADHELFCARTEQINAHIGWKCGNHIVNGGVMGRDLDGPPIWTGQDNWRMETNKK